LTASIDNLNYTQSIKILQIVERPLAIIKTDKFTYNPGEKVNLRIIFLNKDRLPYQSTSEDVFRVKIIDEFENEIYTRDKIEFEEFQEIFEDSFEIGDSSVIGKFFIEVFVVKTCNDDDDNEEKTVIGIEKFEVVENIQDQFTVKMTTNFATSFSENVLKLKILARYNFGNFVRGTAVIKTTLYEENHQEQWQGIKKTIKIENETIVEFNLIDDLKIKSRKSSNIVVNFDLDFVESFTSKKKESKHSTLICVDDCIKIDIIASHKNIKPGFPMTFQVQVTQMETMNLINDEINPIELKVQHYNCSRKEPFEDSFERFLKNGTTNLTIEIPRNISQIGFALKFLSSARLFMFTSISSKSGDFLNIELASKRLVQNFNK
jgi:Macroglobulin domain MG3